MLVYDNKEAKEYAESFYEAQAFGTLQAWLVDDDLRKHAHYLLRRAWSSFVHDAGHSTPRSVLDIGCGSGEMLFQARELFRSYENVGINVFSSQLPEGSTGDFARFIVGNVEKDAERVFNEAGGPFDLVMCNYTLGHIEDPLMLFTRVYNILAPGGVFMMYDVARRTVLQDIWLWYHLYSTTTLVHLLEAGTFNVVTPELPETKINPALGEVEAEGFRLWTVPSLIVAQKEE